MLLTFSDTSKVTCFDIFVTNLAQVKSDCMWVGVTPEPPLFACEGLALCNAIDFWRPKQLYEILQIREKYLINRASVKEDWNFFVRTDVNLAGFGREFTGISKISNQCIFGLCLRKKFETFFADAKAALNFFRLRKLFIHHLIFYVRTKSTLVRKQNLRGSETCGFSMDHFFSFKTCLIFCNWAHARNQIFEKWPLINWKKRLLSILAKCVLDDSALI